MKHLFKTHAFIGSEARYLLIGWTPWNRFKWGVQYVRPEEPRVVFQLGFHKPLLNQDMKGEE